MFGFKKKIKKISMKKINSINRNINLDKNDEFILKEGDNGKNVEILQNMLMSIINIYPDIPIVTLDGNYSSETRNAVEYFQKNSGIKSTGAVDKLTWDRLNLIYCKKDEIKKIEKIDFKSEGNKLNINLKM